MELETSYHKWNFTVHSTSVAVELTEQVEERGPFMGATTNYGSKITVARAHSPVEVLAIDLLRPEFPNCPPGLIEVIVANVRLQQLGVFGLVEAPHCARHDALMSILRNLLEHSEVDVERKYHQIPIEHNGKKCWTLRTESGDVYTASRKYEGGYYSTQIERVKESFIHPLNDRAPELNIVKRATVITIATVSAEPLQYADFESYFS